jgi:Rieske Fe-S protein
MSDRIDRRTALAGAGVTAAALTLVACSANSSSAPVTPVGQQQPDGVLAHTGDVPVGGGVIAGDTVITQPTAGSFEGFSSTCTHLGCKVNEISGGLIRCPCHGSAFRLDGTVAQGPATRPLDARPVQVDGDRIVPA